MIDKMFFFSIGITTLELVFKIKRNGRNMFLLQIKISVF